MDRSSLVGDMVRSLKCDLRTDGIEQSYSPPNRSLTGRRLITLISSSVRVSERWDLWSSLSVDFWLAVSFICVCLVNVPLHNVEISLY